MDDFSQLSELKYHLEKPRMEKMAKWIVAYFLLPPAFSFTLVMMKDESKLTLCWFLVALWLTITLSKFIWRLMVNKWSKFLEGPIQILAFVKPEGMIKTRPCESPISFLLVRPSLNFKGPFIAFWVVGCVPYLAVALIAKDNMIILLGVISGFLCTSLVCIPRVLPFVDVDSLKSYGKLIGSQGREFNVIPPA